jgi:4-carboxymuconolactone decarboxylase
MPPDPKSDQRLSSIDEQTRCLVQIAAAIAGADERATRTVMESAVGRADPAAIDEVILQSYLFAGFPRTLNAARTWRAVSGSPAPHDDQSARLASGGDWVARGEETCRTVYGESYDMLRENIRELHPALDAWMITDGYGKVLSRPGLDLRTRELCIVAACAASGQQRQLHSHLHGALNSGATVDEVSETLNALDSLVGSEDIGRYQMLLSRVVTKRHPPTARAANVR